MPYYIKRKAKKEKPLFKKATVKVKRKPNLVTKLDKVFSLYIRLRDSMPNGYFKCISCGQIKRFDQADCGHFYSRTHMATRFDEDNCSAECSFCNRFKADHLIGYQTNLIKKIGQGRFELLQVKSKSTKKWCDFELETMIKHYTNEVKRLSSEKGIKVSI